jgi:hypothetical protein
MFKRGISAGFVEALRRLATDGPNWWTEVLADDDLIVAVRDEAIDVYCRGQSLLHLGMAGGTVRADTHPKYLLDPDLKRRVPLLGDVFALPSSSTLMERWVPGVTLGKMKRAAKVYAEGEKTAVHAVVRRHPDVLDVEVAVRREPGQEGRELPRPDLVHLEPDGDGVRLAFWEVKLFVNKELRAEGAAAPPVLKQMEDYRRILDVERDNILQSYRRVAENLVAIAEMRPGGRSLGPLIHKVAGAPGILTLGSPPDVGLLITGFDEDQRDGQVWKPHRDALRLELGKSRLRLVGAATGVRL